MQDSIGSCSYSCAPYLASGTFTLPSPPLAVVHNPAPPLESNLSKLALPSYPPTLFSSAVHNQPTLIGECHLSLLFPLLDYDDRVTRQLMRETRPTGLIARKGVEKEGEARRHS